MKRFDALAVVAVTLLLSLVSTGCSPEKPSHGKADFAGAWKGSAQDTGSPNPSFVLNVEQQDETVTGTINSGDGTFAEVAISDTRIENGRLLFHAVANGGNAYKDHLFLFTLRRTGDTLEGTWTDILKGAQGPFSLDLMKDH